jgi:hypothetical protein
MQRDRHQCRRPRGRPWAGRRRGRRRDSTAAGPCNPGTGRGRRPRVRRIPGSAAATAGKAASAEIRQPAGPCCG